MSRADLIKKRKKKTLRDKDIMQKHTLTQLGAIQQNNFMLSFKEHLISCSMPFPSKIVTNLSIMVKTNFCTLHPPFPYKYEFGLPVLPPTAVNGVVWKNLKYNIPE